jgi:hypothetical protein
MEDSMNDKKRGGPWLVTETQAGETYTVGEYRLTPMGKATRFRIPGTNAGLIWNRPASVVAEFSSGETVVVPVKDTTRIVQLALLGTAVAVSAGLLVLSGAASNKRRNL